MKPKLMVTAALIALTGCATGPKDKKPAWEAKPTMDIRHGMANGLAYYQLGRHKEEQGDLAAAEAFYDKSLAADPKSIDALNALGALYARRGETDRAATIYRRAADLSPQSARLYNNIGYTFYLQGRYAEAIDALRRAVTIDPDYQRAWANLQAAARKAGMPEMAALAARRSLEPAAPNSRDVSPPATAAAGASIPAPAGREAIPAEKSQQQGIRLAEVPARPAPNDGILRLAEYPADPRAVGPRPAPAPGIARMPALEAPGRQSGRSPRIEVSNGNGVSRYATGVVGHLRGEGIPVSRVTNFTPFNVRRTYIEYRPAFADPARRLGDRLGSHVLLMEAKADRPGTDIRLVLGADRLAMPARITGRAVSRQSAEG